MLLIILIFSLTLPGQVLSNMSLNGFGTTVIRRSLSRLLMTSISSASQSSNLTKIEDDQLKKKRPGHDVVDRTSSFARDIFVGKFDSDILTYPEILEKERHETLHGMVQPIEKFFAEKG
jgi:hypothetical protein